MYTARGTFFQSFLGKDQKFAKMEGRTTKRIIKVKRPVDYEEYCTKSLVQPQRPKVEPDPDRPVPSKFFWEMGGKNSEIGFIQFDPILKELTCATCFFQCYGQVSTSSHSIFAV